MFAAIDVDGTITRYPLVMGDILSAFTDAVILTGCSCDEPGHADRQALVEGRQRQLRPLLGMFTNEIVVCVGRNSGEVARLKGEFCRDNRVQMLIDDSADYCLAVREISPETCVLRVHP